jgi:NAD(P)-dependent dehydrogenase (short-subunit alcohol dehydrogenase family)
MNSQPHIPAVPAPPAPGRVLVTGATGLLGSNVTAELLAAGAEVLALARSADRARTLLPVHERLRIVEGDITRIDGFADEAAWYRSHGTLPIPRDHASSTERTKAGTV